MPAVNRSFFIPGVPKIAALYKRARYEWEAETRLVFDLQYLSFLGNSYSNLITQDTEIMKDGVERKFVKLFFDNYKGSGLPQDRLVDVSLTKIICGERVSKTEFADIATLAQKNFTEIEIIRFQ
jgi:hypothetical protein